MPMHWLPCMRMPWQGGGLQNVTNFFLLPPSSRHICLRHGRRTVRNGVQMWLKRKRRCEMTEMQLKLYALREWRYQAERTQLPATLLPTFNDMEAFTVAQ